MKIYYSNIAKNFDLTQTQVGCLFSYYSLKEVVVPKFCDSYFLDSGAFSAFQQGTELNLQDYIDFVHKWKDSLDVYASLDVIGDAATSKTNYLEMKKQGLDPLPCVHIGTDVSYIDFYLQHTNYIALGGMAKRRPQIRKAWLDGIFSNYDCDFHGFGVQDVPLLKRYPWYSVDASTWHFNARMGQIRTPWGDFALLKNVLPRYSRAQGSEAKALLRDWVESLGVDFDACHTADSKGQYWRSIVNLLFYENLTEEMVEVKFQKRGSLFL